MQKIGHWLLAKNMNASIVAFVCALLPAITLPGEFLASIIVALVTLRKGGKSGLMVLTWVALPAVAMMLIGKLSLFDIMLARCVLVWALALVLRQMRSWSLVIMLLTVVGAVGVVFFHAWIADPVSFWSAKLSIYFLDMAKSLPLPADNIKDNVQLIAGFATGLLAFVVVLGIFLQLFLARCWQSSLYNPGGLRKEAHQIRVNQWASLVLIFIVIAACFKIAILIDMLPVLLIPFIVAGLSFIHWWVNQKQKAAFLLVLVYVGFVLFPYVSIALALLGIADSWVDLRSRFQLEQSV
ncbi:MAG: hypothetical protein P1U63_11395 [Coxiellaceae bacterium]|nr:hypothetical protein [Coxiellaceae bacterium]